MSARAWDAASYDRVGQPMTEMAAAVLERLPLRGDETVLDAGCGSGRVSELLLERLPRGAVIAVDADPEMVAVARRILGGRARVLHSDLLELSLPEPVDAVLSTATFHWVLDHDRLFTWLHRCLRPGGRLVAQCGGRGNISALRRVADDVASGAPYAQWFDGWVPPWNYAGPEETAQRLQAAGFTNVRTWLAPWPVRPGDAREYLATVTLGAQFQRLPDKLRGPYLDAVIDRLERPVTIDYVRLNIDAERPA